jgi:hypothetical protein
MTKKKIVYIAGYSRSGSTILDILLSSHSNIFGTGELVYLFDDWLNGSRLCTCGEVYQNCPFWKNFKLPQGISFDEAIGILRNIETRKKIKALVGGKIEPNVIQKYKLIQSALYNYIFEVSGKDIIIDSSKSSRDMAGRFYAIHRYTEFDIYVIHLIKNGLSIVESYVKKGRNWSIEGYKKNNSFSSARSSIGWLLANSIAERLGEQMQQHQFIQIKYEILLNHPESVLKRIGEFLNIDISDVISVVKNNELLHPKHNVGGNRLRLEKEIRFNTANHLQKINLSYYHKFVFNLIAGRLNRRLGY